jgi:hypothetical protein
MNYRYNHKRPEFNGTLHTSMATLDSQGSLHRVILKERQVTLVNRLLIMLDSQFPMLGSLAPTLPTPHKHNALLLVPLQLRLQASLSPNLSLPSPLRRPQRR